MKTVVDEEERVESCRDDGDEGRVIANIPYLSQDNVEKILDKVPSPESLFRLRCVSKTWFNSIIIHKNSPFVMHPTNSEPPGILVQLLDNHDLTYLISLSKEQQSQIKFSDPKTYYTLFIKLGKERNQVEQVVDLTSCFKGLKLGDSFNGLIKGHSLSSTGTTYIVNPVTKQRLKIPPCLVKYPTYSMFVPSTGEYIAVQAIRRPLYSGSYARVVKLFSGGDWVVDEDNLRCKLIKIPKYVSIGVDGEKFFFQGAHALAINGILYLTPKENIIDTPRKYIACFDAGEETFYKIPHPDFDPLFDLRAARRWYKEIEGSLGYIRFDTYSRPHCDHLEIYILNDEDHPAAAADRKRVGKKWIKQHSISLAPSILRHPELDGCGDHLLCGLRDGDVIIFESLLDEQHFRVYDVKLNRWWPLGVNLSRGRPVVTRLHSQRTIPVTSLSQLCFT